MRYSNFKQTNIARVVHKIGPLMASVFVILAAAGEAHSADVLRLTDIKREEVREVEEVEEIKVIANREGVPALEFEKMRQERMREVMYAELRLRERIAEEMAWWQADPDLENPESQIKWGYSPQAEIRMNRDNDFVHALSDNHVKPASVFRITF